MEENGRLSSFSPSSRFPWPAKAANDLPSEGLSLTYDIVAEDEQDDNESSRADLYGGLVLLRELKLDRVS